MALGSFSAGLSGLNANATYLSVIGNNLANINTVGYKSSDVSFADLVSQTVGGAGTDPMQVGLGVGIGTISPIFSQGAITNTTEATNVAIQGSGFFVVRGTGGNAYTRAGNFTLDRNGALVTPDGYFVQGYTQTNSQGQIVTSGTPTDIVVPPGVLRPPTATTTFSTVTNLDAGAATAATFSTSVQLYDALGSAHVATITLTRANPTDWTYQISVPGAEATGGTTGIPFNIPAGSGGTGTLRFGANGLLSQVAVGGGALGAPADITVTTPTWKNGAAANALTWNILDTAGVAQITGFTAPSSTSSVTQNGSAPGQINSISIASDGKITATFGAGQTVAVGQLALASFNNPRGLVKLGSNRFGESQSAGIANVGTAGNGGRGTLIGSALEQSNVDLAQEFTKMILAQRGYQANSKSITVSDQLMQDTLNLKQ